MVNLSLVLLIVLICGWLLSGSGEKTKAYVKEEERSLAGIVAGLILIVIGIAIMVVVKKCQ